MCGDQFNFRHRQLFAEHAPEHVHPVRPDIQSCACAWCNIAFAAGFMTRSVDCCEHFAQPAVNPGLVEETRQFHYRARPARNAVPFSRSPATGESDVASLRANLAVERQRYAVSVARCCPVSASFRICTRAQLSGPSTKVRGGLKRRKGQRQPDAVQHASGESCSGMRAIRA